jgi:predicted aspartyl protease/Flp pilus assembly protein TadD
VKYISKALATFALCGLLNQAVVTGAATGNNNDVKTAGKTAEQVDARTKEIVSKLAREARRAIREGKFEEAAKAYRQAIAADATSATARLGLALAHFKLQDYRACYEQASEVIKQHPENARAHALLGAALLRSGYVKEAAEQLNKAAQLNSREPLAIGAAAEIDYYEGRAVQAREKAFRAYSLDQQEPDYLITISRAATRLDRFGEAADAYERFLEVAPPTEKERRERIKGLIRFYRRLDGLRVHEVSGPQTSEARFDLRGDRRPYLKVRVNGREATFVIDTGSGTTVISKQLAERFGISQVARGDNSQGLGGDGKFPIVYGLVNTLQIGELKIKSVPVFIQHFYAGAGENGKPSADGLLGLSVLSHFLTELDYENSRVRLSRRTATPSLSTDAAGATVIPFRTTQNGLISIETELENRHRIHAILDSAASSTVVSSAAVERLNMRDNIVQGQTASVVGAAGLSEKVEIIFIRKCRVANLEQKNMRAVVLDFGMINEASGFEQSGIIGGDFLHRYRVTIDFARALIAFHPRSNASTQ